MNSSLNGSSVASIMVITVLCVTTTFTNAGERSPTVKSTKGNARLIVLRNSAQWCSTCNSAKKAYIEVKKQFGTKPILFVTLDRTDDISSRQAAYLLKALGIDKALVSKNAGTFVIIDTLMKKTISIGQLSPNAAPMVKMIEKALGEGS